MIKKLFLPIWILGAVFLLLYSYTQVDLSLTLSRASFLQDIQKGFQYIGWFNRPLSTLIYVFIFVALFTLYLKTVNLIKKNELDKKTLWLTIILVTAILTFSYNAFSYDLFNYIFDAKIVTFYNQNPYLHKALDFPNDPMLSFMHWTHRVYPYGPVWLFITVPMSFLGLQYFIITYFLFKIVISAFFLLTGYAIYKITNVLNYKNLLLPLGVFALNPFVLSESLVSSHNDIVMMGLFMLGSYYLLDNKNIKGWFFTILSIGTKFATIIPAILFVFLKITGKTKYFIKGSIYLMVVAVILATMRTTFQPWYLLFLVPLVSLETKSKAYLYPLIILSIGGVIFYIPFLYYGNWDSLVSSLISNISIITVILATVVHLFYLFRHEIIGKS